MEKILRTMLTVVALVLTMAAYAAEKSATFDFTVNSWGKPTTENTDARKLEKNEFGTATENGVTLTTAKAEAPTIYPSIAVATDGASGVTKMYLFVAVKNTIALKVDASSSISKIVVNYTSTMTASPFESGSWTSAVEENADGNGASAETLTMEGAYSEVLLLMKRSAYIGSIVVTYSDSQGGGTTGGGDNPGGGNDGPTVNVDDLDDGVVVNTDKRMLVMKSQFGDSMGESSRDVCTGQKSYYYDKNYNLVSVVNNKTELGGLYFAPTDYQYYNYDSNGNLVSVEGYQIGTYDFGEKAARRSVAVDEKYEYNSNGQCISKTVPGKDNTTVTYNYTYNAAGQLVSESNLSTSRTVEYKYNADGTLASIEQILTDEEAMTKPDECYIETYTYSKAGHKVMVERKMSRDVEYLYANIGGNKIYRTKFAGTPLQKETWKYEGGYVKEYYKYFFDNNGNELPASRNIYNYTTDMLEFSYVTEVYNASKNVWSEQPQMFVETYKDFSKIDAAAYASEIQSVKQSTDAADGLNCAVVEFTMPDYIMQDGMLDLVIYRDGLRVHTVCPAQWDEVGEFNLTYNESTGTMIYKDKRVKNGKHEYFIQTAPSAGSMVGGVADLDDPDPGMGLIPNDHEESFIVSNRVAGDIYTKLPTAQNLKCVGKSSGTQTKDVTIEFEYDDTIAPEFGFKRTFLVANGALFFDAESAAYTESTSVLQLTDEYDSNVSVSVQVVTQYALGTVLSEPFVFVPATVPVQNPTGITDVNVKAGKLMMIDALGRKVNNGKGLIKIVK